MDLGNMKLKDILENQLGKEKAKKVIEHANEGYKKGLRGEDLKNHCQSILKEVGHTESPDTSFGCAIFL